MAVLRILSRADRLGIKFDTPIAVAMVGTKKRKHVSYINSAAVKTNLEVSTKATHDIKADKALGKFSTQFIRVKICVLMDAADEKSYNIKRLRRKSDTFMDYCRNITRLATNHNTVTTKAIATSMAS